MAAPRAGPFPAVRVLLHTAPSPFVRLSTRPASYHTEVQITVQGGAQSAQPR
jgi:hypothetical protein